jgi:hypothetical protein
MPKYYKEHARGYDLDLEFEFIEIDGVRCQLGTAGSVILVCPTCGAERFRERPSHLETCWKGHGEMVPLPLRGELRDKLHAMWCESGDTFTTVEERKARRLEDEAKRPWNWVFGDKTEVDFPEGYVKSAYVPEQTPMP